MQEFAIYSVIPPEGCAAILWRDANRKVEAAAALKITAPDLLALGHHRRDRARADGRRPQRLRRGRPRSSTRPCAQALAELSPLTVDELLAGRYESSGAWAGKGRRSSTSARPRETAPGSEDRTMKSLLWQHLPCNEDDASRRSATALNLHPTVARLLCHARAGRPGGGGSVSESVARPPPRSVAARRHGPRRRRGSSGRWPTASGSPSTATTTSTASRRPSSCAARSSCSAATSIHFIPERLRDGYGLQPAAIERLHAERRRRSIVSVDCGIRGTEAARRARELGRRPHHHRSPRAGRRRCRRRSP